MKSRKPNGDPERVNWFLRLYIAGKTSKSAAAYANLKRICEEHLPGKYRMEVIDLLETPDLAIMDQILAIPTLVRKSPAPVRRIIGDLSDTDRVLISLEVPSGPQLPI